LVPIVDVRSLVRWYIAGHLSTGRFKIVGTVGIVAHVALVAVGVPLEEFTKKGLIVCLDGVLRRIILP
jgi:hypothetical protein